MQSPPASPQETSMTPLMYRLIAKQQDFDDTVTLDLAPEGEAVPVPKPGQFNMLWAFGIGEVAISLAGYSEPILTHTIRGVGKVSSSLCATLVGGQIGIRGPFGRGWDVGRAMGGDVAIIAGGLGLAPVRPIVDEIIANRGDFERVALLVGARSPDSLLYRHDLERWRQEFDVDVQVTVDSASREWQGNTGVVTSLIDTVDIDPAATTAFVCGPEVMMCFAAEGLIRSGVAPARVFVSIERNMHCAVGHCGHCQLGPLFICKDGPVLSWPEVEPLLAVHQL